MINNDAGAKALIASIRNLARQDYANNGGCPEGCLFEADCPNWKNDAKYHYVKYCCHDCYIKARFWSEDELAGVDICT